jgi:peptidoglycan DL-endopeptidase CwlO
MQTSTAVKGCAGVTFHSRFVAKTVVVLVAVSAVWGGAAYAEPGQDAVAQLNDLTQQAQQLLENVQSAQLDLDKKLQLLNEADKKHADDLAALDAARAELAPHQAVLDNLAAALYMGGPADGMHAIFTAASPQSFIDKLAIQKLMTTQMSNQVASFRRAKQEAETSEATSAESAIEAKVAADAAAALRADLQTKQSALQTKVAEVKVRYGMLTPAEQALLGPGAAIPTVGMGGLAPNARTLAAYIIATYPGVQTIGGVRADALPDHPSGHAIDIMIGSDMALGDAINADVQAQAGRFGVKYTMWRVANHFNHVHVTVS